MQVSVAFTVSLLACLCLVVGRSSAQQPDAQVPRGGVLELTEKTFVKTIQSTSITLVSFFTGNPAEASYEGYLMQALEYVAAAIRDKGVKVKIAVVQASKNPGLIKQLGIQVEARPIMLFRSNSMPQEYFGQRTAEGIAQFLMEIISSKPVRMVSTKAEKKKYDEYGFAKVVAYVEPGSKMEKWYTLAGEHFLPTVPFFQVTDKKIAKSLRLKKPGAGLFVKPNEKALPIPSDVSEEKGMIRFVYTNRKQALMQLRMLEMHLTWSGILSPNLFLGVLKPKSDTGSRLFASLKTAAKHFASNKTLHMAWLDPASDVQQMLPQWSKTFDRDLTTTSGSLGFVSLAQNKHAWLDLNEGDIISKPKRIIQWISDALSGGVELHENLRGEEKPQAAQEDDFDMPEEAGESSERSDFDMPEEAGESSERSEL